MKLLMENWRGYLNEAGDVTAIISDLFSNSECSATEINRGQCEDFMIDLMQRLPDGAIERTVPFDSGLPGHYWVEYQGKHYDSEAPEGVKDWKDLPIFRRSRNK